MFSFIKRRVKLAIKQVLYRLHNKNNWTYIVNKWCNINAIEVGDYSYGPIIVLNQSKINTPKLKIGRFCSIGDNVFFVLNSEHDYSRVSTYPFKAKCLGVGEFEPLSKGDIVIDDDVWIGCNATILSGVHIGQGAVIAAGALVANDVPPYAIVGGVPAKVIRYRFSSELIEELCKIDYKKLTITEIKNHIEDLYEPVLNQKQFEWMQRKK